MWYQKFGIYLQSADFLLTVCSPGSPLFVLSYASTLILSKYSTYIYTTSPRLITACCSKLGRTSAELLTAHFWRSDGCTFSAITWLHFERLQLAHVCKLFVASQGHLTAILGFFFFTGIWFLLLGSAKKCPLGKMGLLNNYGFHSGPVV